MQLIEYEYFEHTIIIDSAHKERIVVWIKWIGLVQNIFYATFTSLSAVEQLKKEQDLCHVLLDFSIVSQKNLCTKWLYK